MAPTDQRKYDLVLLGATGFTGALCAEYITTHLPTTIRWAIAGRSEHKLLNLLINLKNLNPDRNQPHIELVELLPADLARLAQSTTLLINTVGPYHLYSSPVIAACAQQGTHYLDVTGESPWVLDMIKRYHSVAATNHALIIPQTGLESAPSDLLVFLLASLLRKLGCTQGMTEAIGSLHDMNSAPSGGTLATALGIWDAYSVKEIAAGTKWTHLPKGLSPPKPQQKFPSLLTTLLGVRTVTGLGTLTTSLNAGPNIATVQRTWGLLDSGRFYGPGFQYKEYMAVRSTLIGCLAHIAIVVGMLLLTLPPIRWLLKKVVYAPGQGPGREAMNKEHVEQRCVATAVDGEGRERKAFGRFRWEGGIYYMSGVLLAEAAMCILRNEERLVERLGGGVLTPACLGESFVDRLRGAGAIVECEMMEKF